MSELDIPYCLDIVSAFGCECSLDDDYWVQTMHFQDSDKNKLQVSVSRADHSVTIVLSDKNEFVINNFFFVYLTRFLMDAKKNTITLYFGSEKQQLVVITLWERFSIFIEDTWY
jgi:hypothetical protein